MGFILYLEMFSKKYSILIKILSRLSHFKNQKSKIKKLHKPNAQPRSKRSQTEWIFMVPFQLLSFTHTPYTSINQTHNPDQRDRRQGGSLWYLFNYFLSHTHTIHIHKPTAQPRSKRSQTEWIFMVPFQLLSFTRAILLCH